MVAAGGGELYPTPAEALAAASGVPDTEVQRFNPVRQFLSSFPNSIQEFSQQRKGWRIGWSLNPFLSFLLPGWVVLSFFISFLQALSYTVLFHLIIAN